MTQIRSGSWIIRRSDIGWKSGAEGAGQGREAPTESGSLDACRCSRRIRSRERRIVTKSSMGIRVAPVDDFAGVLGRVQGSLRRSEWSLFHRALDTASALPVMGFYRSDPLSSRAGTHASCIGGSSDNLAREMKGGTTPDTTEDGPPACANTRTTLTTRLTEPTGVAVADLATARHPERRLL